MNNKRHIGLWVAWLWTLCCTAQMPASLQEWSEKLKAFGTKLPQEQVFVHMDNTCYFKGDTIYYKAYVRRSDTGAPSRISGVLYADLLNQDGYLVQRQQLELKGGQANGTFVLPDTIYGGYYELRAYTRWQLNWGRTQHPHTSIANRWFINKAFAHEYFTDYEKLYSRTFPVYDKPEEPGLFTHDMTMRPLRRHVKQSDKPLDAVVGLFPEGGNLVAGVPCRMAFEANDEEGQHLEGTFSIVDGNDAVVAEASCVSRGRGVVTFTPQADDKYAARFTWKDGTKKIKLPKVQPEGVSITILQDAECRKAQKVVVRLAAQGAAANEALGVTVMTDGVLRHFEELPANATHQMELDASALPNGVAQLTVFNANGNIYADRLFFVRHTDLQAHSLQFTGDTYKDLKPFAQAQVAVAGGIPGSAISLAVRDGAHMEYTYDTGNILTEMLLSSQIRGFVEQPEYFFEADDEEHHQALDLLLMVQGWRRYDWHTMTVPHAFELFHKPESTPFMVGEVCKYQAEGSEDFYKDFAADVALMEKAESHGVDRVEKSMEDEFVGDDVETIQQRLDENDGQFKSSNTDYLGRINERYSYRGSLKREVLVHAEFTKPESTFKTAALEGEVMTTGGQFSLQTPRFYEGCYFFLSASDSTKWKQGENHVWIREARDKRDELNYPEFYVRLKRYLPRFVKPYSWYQCHLADLPTNKGALTGEWLNDGTRRLSEITVTGRRNLYTRFNANAPAYVIDAYEAFNEACDLGLMIPVFQGGGQFSDAMARTYIGDMNMERAYDFERRFDGKNASSYVAEGVKKYYNHLERLDKVYIYTDYSPRREGDKRFEQSNQPEVIIDLHLLADDAQRPTYRDRRYVLPGFSVPEEFYQPDYSQKPLPELKDYRRTLYWNPNLQLDEKGEAQVSFYNNCTPTRLSISAEGIAPDGTLMTGKE